MDDETHINEDFNSGSPRENPGVASYGVFSGSQHFTVAGGTFTNTTTTNYYHTAPAALSDFRRIPMGEIDLQREIRRDRHSGVAEYRHERRSVRRVYSAKVDRGKSSVTVATYQGDSTEEDWRRDVARYIAMRHPNIVQLCGTASSGNIHATVFHDDLIPFQNFVELHQHSHLSTVYIYAYIDSELKAVRYYSHPTFQHESGLGCTLLIRRSTGRICVDLAPGNIWLYTYHHLDRRSHQLEFKSLNAPSLEATALDSLTLEEYHEICYRQLSQRRYGSVYNPITVNIGAVISCSSGNRLEDLVEIAILPRTDSGFNRRWCTADSGVVMENGWTRLRSSYAVAKTYIQLSVGYFDSNHWLSQANHTFKHLGILSNFEDYVLLKRVCFFLSILSSSTAASLGGFLFLCPPTDFQIGPSLFKWPECPAYWSLDSFGADPLSWEDAANLGFPSLQLSMTVWGSSWDASVYARIRQFHRGKGFDPDSQDLALYLGQPLYELPSEIDLPFAHIDNQHLHDIPEEQDPSGSITEPENVLESANADDGAVNASPAEEIPVSGTFTFVLVVQLSLILCLVLFWLYDRLWIWRFK